MTRRRMMTTRRWRSKESGEERCAWRHRREGKFVAAWECNCTIRTAAGWAGGEIDQFPSGTGDMRSWTNIWSSRGGMPRPFRRESSYEQGKRLGPWSRASDHTGIQQTRADSKVQCPGYSLSTNTSTSPPPTPPPPPPPQCWHGSGTNSTNPQRTTPEP